MLNQTNSFGLQARQQVCLQQRRSIVANAKAKAVAGKVKLNIEAGKANPAPPIGPALGALGVNIMGFCKEYNAATQDKLGEVVPVELTVYEDRSFTFVLKNPPTSELLKKEAGLEKGSGLSGKTVIATISYQQAEKIAKIKFEEMNVRTLRSATSRVIGTARNMGIAVSAPEEEAAPV